MYMNLIRCQELYDDMLTSQILEPYLVDNMPFEDRVSLFIQWTKEFEEIAKKRATEPDWDWIAETDSFFCRKLKETFLYEKAEEDKTMEANYTTLREDFGNMPLPGYIAELNQKICMQDGWDVIAFLKMLEEITNELYSNSEKENWKEDEAFVILSYDFDSSMELQWEILYDLDNSEKKFDYDTHYYRIYTKDQDWGLDEIEPIKEKRYSVVKVEMSRIRQVTETKTIYIAVDNDFSDKSPETEVNHYISNSYCHEDNGWKEYDDFYNSNEWEDSVVVQETTVVDYDYNMDDYDYEIEETLD